MADPTYRFAAVDDLEQLIELRIRMQKEVNPQQASNVRPEYIESLRRYFARHLADGTYVSSIAEIDGKLLAATGLVIYSKPPSITGGTGRVGYVSNVYTLPEWRGRGIASELMKLLVEHARAQGVDRLHLGTTELGKGVYERIGFKPPRFPYLELGL